MKQIEIDLEIAGWFRARDKAIESKRQALQDECAFANCTNRLAKRLLPDNPVPGEKWILPSTNGKAVVVFLKAVQAHCDDGKVVTNYEPDITEHLFKK